MQQAPPPAFPIDLRAWGSAAASAHAIGLRLLRSRPPPRPTFVAAGAAGSVLNKEFARF
jgi:hypothetical protein